MRLVALNQLVWAPLPRELRGAQWKLEAALRAWKNTPYRSGQRLRGVGGDCIGDVFGVIDDIDGRPRAQNPVLPADTALHDPESAHEAVGILRRLYSPAKRLHWTDGTLEVQPGDLLVVGPSLGGPGHLMIVGTQKNTIWHASNSAEGFCMTGWALGDGFERLFAVYRLGDRERWGQ